MADKAYNTGKDGGGEEEADILRECREKFHEWWEYDRENREAAEDDLRFAAGDQWDEKIKQERDGDNRPCLTIPRLNQYISQVTGDIRLNRPSIKVRPVDEGSDEELAKGLTGLIRHIEQASDAQTAYNTAAENAATCGMGHFRIVTEYSDDDAFEQDIRIKRIKNPFGVTWDSASQELDYSDARGCFVSAEISKTTFKEKYPDAKPIDFDGPMNLDYLDEWIQKDTVRVAEYWCKKPVTKTLALLDDGKVVEVTKDNPAPANTIKTRQIKTHKVVQYIVNGVEILEGPNDWAGKYIPVITVKGREVYLGNKVVRYGIVRFAKDVQRMYNFMRSAAVESFAATPKAPFIVTLTQIKGHESKWETANQKNYPYLPYNHDANATKPSREPPPSPNMAAIEQAQAAAQDMDAIVGIYPAALGAKSNETSGKAILARQKEADVGSFVYADNLSKAIAYCGRQLVDLIPKIYDTPRVIRVLGEDDSVDYLQVNQPDPMQPERIINDLAAGEYDVVVETGPSFSTKRQEAAESMMQFTQTNPQIAAVIGDLIAGAQDWPYADKIAERLKKTLPPGLAEDEDGAPAGPPQPPQPTPEMMLAAKEAELKDKELTIKDKELDVKAMEVAQKGAQAGRDFAMQRGEALARGVPVNDVDGDGNPAGQGPLDMIAMGLQQQVAALAELGRGLQAMALAQAAPKTKQVQMMMPSGPVVATVTEVGNA